MDNNSFLRELCRMDRQIAKVAEPAQKETLGSSVGKLRNMVQNTVIIEEEDDDAIWTGWYRCLDCGDKWWRDGPRIGSLCRACGADVIERISDQFGKALQHEIPGRGR